MTKLLPTSILGIKPRHYCLGKPAPELLPKPRPLNKILFFGSDTFSVKVFSHLNQCTPENYQCIFDICTKMPLNTLHSQLEDKGKMINNHNLRSYFRDMTLMGHPLLNYLAHNSENNFTINPWPPQLIDEQLQSSLIPLKQSMCKYDFGIIASFGAMIPKSTISAFRYGIICIHPSLLPRWRGPCPLHHTLLANDPYAGITIFKIVPNHFDKGPIIVRQPIPIQSNDNFITLRDKLAILGADLCVEKILSKFPQSLKDDSLIDQSSHLAQNLLQPLPVEGQKSNTPEHPKALEWVNKVKMQKDSRAHKLDWINMLKVDWSRSTLSQLLHLYRALGHTYGGLRSSLNGEPIKLQEPTLLDNDTTALNLLYHKYAYLKPIMQAASKQLKTPLQPKAIKFGALFYSYQHHTLYVACAATDTNFGWNIEKTCVSWSWIGFKRIVYNGKSMSARDFYNGFLTKPPYVGAILV